MLRSALLLALPLMLTGCFRYTIHMKQAGVTEGPDYVIVKIKGSKDVIYDCKSAPEGEHDPICVKVRMLNAPVKADRTTERRSDRMRDE